MIIPRNVGFTLFRVALLSCVKLQKLTIYTRKYLKYLDPDIM